MDKDEFSQQYAAGKKNFRGLDFAEAR